MTKNYFTDAQVKQILQKVPTSMHNNPIEEYKTLMNLAVETAIGEVLVLEAPNYNNEAMGCGLEDRNITDRYEAMFYGFESGVERVFEQIPEALIYSVKELEN